MKSNKAGVKRREGDRRKEKGGRNRKGKKGTTNDGE